MIIDHNRHPEQTLFYIGAKQLDIMMAAKNKLDVLSLFNQYNKKNKVKISFNYHLLGLDWLYILDLIDINETGDLLCT